MLDAARTLLELSVNVPDKASTSKDFGKKQACYFYYNGPLEKENEDTKTENIQNTIQGNKLVKEELQRLSTENQQLKRQIQNNEFSDKSLKKQ